MEESKSLHRLAEAADLVGMIEDMMNPQMTERLSSSAWAGVRITLRNVREMISASHAAMSNDLVSRSRTAAPVNQVTPTPQPARVEISAAQSVSLNGSADGRSQPAISRRDLKASLERLVDR